MSRQLEEKYFRLLEAAVRATIETPTEESRQAAMSAIRRYKALMKRDYKTLWEESEGLLAGLQTEIDSIKAQLDIERGIISGLIRDLFILHGDSEKCSEIVE